MKKFTQIVYSIMPFCEALLIMVLVYSILTAVFTTYYDLGVIPVEVGYIIPVIAAIITGIVFFFWYKRTEKPIIKEEIKKISSIKVLLLLVLLGIGCQFFASGAISIISRVFPEVFKEYDVLMDANYQGNPVVVAIYLVLLAPVTEELIFRGMTMAKSREVLPFLGANLLQASLFGIYHWNPVQSAYAFLNGLLFGYIYKKFGTLLAPVLLHIVINASSYLIMSFNETKITVIMITLIGGAFLSGAMIFIMRRK